MGRIIPSRDVIIAVLRGQPDRMAIQAASLGAMTNTISPGSRGRHEGAPSFFQGTNGYGVNRYAGAWPYQSGAVQRIAQPVAPIAQPISARVGIGYGPGGQPGLPQAGQQGNLATLAWLSGSQLGQRGMGS